jgi:hypothetical protein
MDDKITIIEGPPPTFAPVHDSWLLGLHEGTQVGNVVVTQLRTINGPALVERCYRAWSNRQSIHLVFRSSDGLERQAPIVAARNIDLPEGYLLLLWLHLTQEELAELAVGGEEDDNDEPEL